MFFKKLLFLSFCIFCATITATDAAAADVPASPRGTLTLADALSLALRQSPELAAYSWDVRAAEARVIQARLRPNPELSLEAEDVAGTREFRGGEQAERTLQLSQLVELGGKRPARIAEAQAGRALAGWDYQVKRVEVLRETTQRFIDVLVAQRRVALARETVSLNQTAVPLTERRVEVGKASAVETTRANVSVALAEIAGEQARRELLAAKASLAAMWGETRSARFEGVSGDLDRIGQAPAFSTLAARLGSNPQLARWTTEREKRAAALRLQQAQAVPDITVMGGPRVFGNAENVSTGVLGVSLPLPLFNRNQGGIAEARALLSKTEPEARAAEARAFAELSAAYQTLQSAAAEAATLKDIVIPGAKQSVDLLTNGYEAGRFSQIEILLERRALFDARLQHLRALADYHKALAAVEALTAGPVENLHRRTAAPAKTTRRAGAFRK